MKSLNNFAYKLKNIKEIVSYNASQLDDQPNLAKINNKLKNKKIKPLNTLSSI